MPSWSIHLALAKKLNKKLKLDKDLFYYGNLIPDTDKESILKREDAHYYDINCPCKKCPNEILINKDKFLNEYKDKLNSPLILGYYCHLLADDYYNDYTFSNKWVQDENNNIIGIKYHNKVKIIENNDPMKLKKKYKHHDFCLYGKFLYNNDLIELPQDKNKIYEESKKLKLKYLPKDLINQRINYLNNQFKKSNKFTIKQKLSLDYYKIFTKKELDLLFDNCYKYILKEIEKIK